MYAILSAACAGFTGVVAKLGLSGISAELGLAVRTAMVFGFVLLFAIAVVPLSALSGLGPKNYLWLGISAASTALSWIFYYKALKDGEASTIALIDKGSVVVAVLLAWVILKEEIRLQTIAGAGLILCGLWVIAKKS
jgi:transporter family protein